MEISGEFELRATRQEVWEALQDPGVLKVSIPGCNEFEKESDNEFRAKVTAKVGPMKATFDGKVTLLGLDPPSEYTIAGEGKAGPAGFAKGTAKVVLEEVENGTLLRYLANGAVGGKLAQVGSRVVEGTARKFADEFFRNFAEQVGGAPVQAAPGATEPSAAVFRPLSGLVPTAFWIGGLIVVAIILLVLLL